MKQEDILGEVAQAGKNHLEVSKNVFKECPRAFVRFFDDVKIKDFMAVDMQAALAMADMVQRAMRKKLLEEQEKELDAENEE